MWASARVHPAPRTVNGLPVPSRAADLHEVWELAGVLKEHGRGVVEAAFGPDLHVGVTTTEGRTDVLRDREALAAALGIKGAGYIGMIGSDRKVQQVFEQLQERGVSKEDLQRVYAPLGLDIGADSPAEIAVSVLAEILAILRKRTGKHLSEPTK